MTAIIVSTEVDGEHVDVADVLFVPGPHATHSVRFSYDRDFVRRGWPIDPTLPLDTAAHLMRHLPLALQDASPDSWGELLLQRAERRAAEQEGRPARKLTPDELLLASSDATRQGALRFRSEHDGEFLATNGAVPRIFDLRELLDAADAASTDPHAAESWEAFERLLDAGSSALGGARPKAAVLDDHGELWLAKFPQRGDRTDVPVWEMVALDIAERAGLTVPGRRLLTVGGRQVLMVRRFDRVGEQRLHYLSARTLMRDVDPSMVADYGGRRGLAARLARESVDAVNDLELLWRQAALNLFVNNTDNHLRNHGLLRHGEARTGGWRLSPVFDLDPNPDTGTPFNTTYGGAGSRSTGVRGLMRIAADCGLDDRRAREVLHEVWEAVTGWDADAASYGAGDAEIELYEQAFTGLDEELSALD